MEQDGGPVPGAREHAPPSELCVYCRTFQCSIYINGLMLISAYFLFKIQHTPYVKAATKLGNKEIHTLVGYYWRAAAHKEKWEELNARLVERFKRECAGHEWTTVSWYESERVADIQGKKGIKRAADDSPSSSTPRRKKAKISSRKSSSASSDAIASSSSGVSGPAPLLSASQNTVRPTEASGPQMAGLDVQQWVGVAADGWPFSVAGPSSSTSGTYVSPPPTQHTSSTPQIIHEGIYQAQGRQFQITGGTLQSWMSLESGRDDNPPPAAAGLAPGALEGLFRLSQMAGGLFSLGFEDIQ